MQEHSVIIIGHRQCPDLDHNFLAYLLEVLVRFGYSQFLCGGMGEFDYLCAKFIHRLKPSYPQIKSYFVPHKPSAYVRDISLFTHTITPLELDAYSGSQRIIERNRFMVDLADLALCYVIREQGGAARTMHYAREEKKKIVNIGTYTIE